MVIKILDINIENSDEFNNQIDYAFLNYKIIKIHDDSKGDLIVVPAEDQDAVKLVKDTNFFYGYEKRNLAREAFTLAINNLTLSEIEEDDELMDELVKLGIVDVVKLTQKQADYNKLVKAYCENESIKRKLENANIMIKTRTGRDLLFITSPNVSPPNQCGIC